MNVTCHIFRRIWQLNCHIFRRMWHSIVTFRKKLLHLTKNVTIKCHIRRKMWQFNCHIRRKISKKFQKKIFLKNCVLYKYDMSHSSKKLIWNIMWKYNKHIPAEMSIVTFRRKIWQSIVTFRSAKCYNQLSYFCAKCDNWTFLLGMCLSYLLSKFSFLSKFAISSKTRF